MRLKHIIYSLAVFTTIVVVLFFSLRNYVLNKAIATAQQRLKTQYSLNMTVGKASFSGLLKVETSNTLIKGMAHDTMVYLNYGGFDISFLKLLRGKIAFDFISMDGLQINIIDSPQYHNLASILHSTQPGNHQSQMAPINYKKLFANYKDKVVAALKTGFEIYHIHINVADNERTTTFDIPASKYDFKTLTATIYSNNQQWRDTFLLRCNVIEEGKKYRWQFDNASTSLHYLPFYDRDSMPKLKIQQLTGNIEMQDNVNGTIAFNTDLACKNLSLNYFRLATEDIIVYDASFDFNIMIDEHRITIDSTSKVSLNKIYGTCYTMYDHRDSGRLAIQLSLPNIVAQDFFDGLPQNMFSSLHGIKAEGKFSYAMFFDCSFSNPDSLVFISQLNNQNFRLKKFGAENFSRINSDFIFEALDDEKVMRNIFISPLNPAYIPYTYIDSNLIHAVLTSEDGSFFFHKGFNEEAFRQALITNIKERRFARGGSTISMQLVKNCFLSRNKTFSRKLEEIIIVWLIEHEKIISKERMLEVYFNVIEWGPNVYGIGEASAFYFNKHPASLTLEECIFLAGIVPRPKYFKYQFTKDHRLKPCLQQYYDLVKRKMLQRNWLAPIDTVYKPFNITLTGAAAMQLPQVDTLVVDSLLLH